MKLTKLLLEYPGAFTPAPDDEVERNRQDIEKRKDPNYKVQQYIKNGSKGDLDLIEMDYEGNLQYNYHLLLKSLPDNLYVDGNLYIPFTSNLEYLPKNLIVKNSLYMNDSGVKELPADLKVGNLIFATNTDIKYLPDNLTTKSLVLNRSKIEDIPYGLNLSWGLEILDTPLTRKYTRQEISKMISDRGGHVGSIKTKKRTFEDNIKITL